MSELAEPSTIDVIRDRLGDCILEAQESGSEIRIEATAQGLRELGFFLRDEMGFDYPADLTAYDTSEDLVLWYRLYSMADNRTTIIHVRLNREHPIVPSAVDIWPGVNWHERECFDLFGIEFTGHPDQGDPEQMRILLPEDWEGHPFRKDYEPVFSDNPLHGPQRTN